MNEKNKRQDLISDYIKKKKGKCSRKEILDELEKQGCYVHLTTISRDIDELNYEKGPEGSYIVKISTANKRKSDALVNILANDSLSFSGPYLMPWNAKEDDDLDKPKKNKDILIFLIQVTAGFEATISELIYSIYKDNVRGVIPGHGCILVLAKNVKSCSAIVRGLRELRQKANHKSNTSTEDYITDIE